MDAIRKFEITGLTLSGFKCFARPTEIRFGNPTVITGGNGRGKSSLADAIAFAVTGLPFFGERGIDRLHAEDTADLFIAMRLRDDAGTEHELTRTRQKGRMLITYDGREIRQTDLTDLFGEKDVFLSILNPLYFIEELGESGKKLLERYLPELPQQQVLDCLPASVQESLQQEQILSPESYLKKKREQIRELENSNIYLTGQKDLASSQRQQAREQYTYITEHLTKLQGEYAQLNTRRTTGFDAVQTQEQLVALSERYEMLAKAPLVGKEAEGSADTLGALHQKLGQRRAEEYVPKYGKQMEETSAKVKELAQRYKNQKSLLQQLQPGALCPSCRRPVSSGELPAVQRDMQLVMQEVITQGKAMKVQLDELTELEKKAEDTFRKFQKEDVERLEQEIRTLARQEKTEAEQSAAERNAELESLRTQIRELTAISECGMLSPDEHERFLKCGSEIEECEAALKALQQTAEAVPEDFDAQIRQNEEQIAVLKKQIADMALYMSKRAELLFSSLRMNRVEISLYDVVKTTGEVKDTFKFTYYGRRYDRLSLSEKIRAGMEISELIKRLTGRNYPQFVDNMESVDDLNNVKPTGQIIMAKCVRGAELSARVPGQEQPAARAA